MFTFIDPLFKIWFIPYISIWKERNIIMYLESIFSDCKHHFDHVLDPLVNFSAVKNVPKPLKDSYVESNNTQLNQQQHLHGLTMDAKYVKLQILQHSNYMYRQMTQKWMWCELRHWLLIKRGPFQPNLIPLKLN